jgi:hypothetical protein
LTQNSEFRVAMKNQSLVSQLSANQAQNITASLKTQLVAAHAQNLTSNSNFVALAGC